VLKETSMCLGVPGRVVEIGDAESMSMGVVDFGGVRRETCLVYVEDEVSLGDYVIVHAGFAISKLDEEEAKRTLELLQELGEFEDAARGSETAEPNLSEQNPNAT
jgi:hydrogenase expression/formation protein HypC